jgi:hypothetical protein
LDLLAYLDAHIESVELMEKAMGKTNTSAALRELNSKKR